MTEAIIVALIAGACAVIGNIIVSRSANREVYSKLDKQSEINDQKLDAKLDKYQAVTNEKISNLTDEVRKHNNFAEKIPVLEEKIKAANHRIDSLEKTAS